MKSLGLDVHAASFTLALVTEKGQEAWVRRYGTTAHNLIEVISQVPGPKALAVEESHLAQWVKRNVERYVDRFVICDPRKNESIHNALHNDDRRSARQLAEKLYENKLKPIVHPEEEGEELRALFLHYFDLMHQLAKAKVKLKATFRQEAVSAKSGAIYVEEDHAHWLRKLRGRPHLEHEAAQQFELVDLLERQKAETCEKMTRAARRRGGYKFLESIPGAGPVIVSGYEALIDTPDRFSRENKLWSYAGLANEQHSSDDVVYVDHASHEGNRVLKWVVIQHFMAVVERSKDGNRFQRMAQRLQQRGLSYSALRRQVCRALLSTVRAVWMKGELYRDDPLK